MKRAILVLILLLVGCESREAKTERLAAEAVKIASAKAAREAEEAAFRAKVDLLKTKKILNIRVNDSSLDFILEDGNILTVYSYQTERYVNQRTYYDHYLGVK